MTDVTPVELTPGPPRPTGAALHRGSSRQDYETPAVFLSAVVERFGPIAWDLAATAENAKAPRFFSPHDDSLAQDWTKLEGNCFCNPPFGDIAPWAAKCAASRGFRWDDRRILLLVPASVGSLWFAEHVDMQALVLFLRPRLSFDGKHPFPKDLALAVYGETPGYECWDWKAASDVCGGAA